MTALEVAILLTQARQWASTHKKMLLVRVFNDDYRTSTASIEDPVLRKRLLDWCVGQRDRLDAGYPPPLGEPWYVDDQDGVEYLFAFHANGSITYEVTLKCTTTPQQLHVSA